MICKSALLPSEAAKLYVRRWRRRESPQNMRFLEVHFVNEYYTRKNTRENINPQLTAES